MDTTGLWQKVLVKSRLRRRGRVGDQFTRSDPVAALQLFGDEVLSNAHVIRVQASERSRVRGDDHAPAP